MKNKKNKKNKRLITLLLPLLLISGGGAITGAYAYWNMLEKTKEETIELGQGVVLSVDVVASAPTGQTLVPTGKIINPATQVDEIVLSYNVGLAHDASSVGDLKATVVASKIAIGADEALGTSYVNVAISPGEGTFELSTTDTEVTVTITLDEPVNQTDYEAIAGKNITFTLTFTAALAA